MDRTKPQSPNKILFTLFAKYSQNLTDTFEKPKELIAASRQKIVTSMKPDTKALSEKYNSSMSPRYNSTII